MINTQNENDIQFLLNELGKEWAVSKRTKKIVEVPKEKMAGIYSMLEGEIKQFDEARRDEGLTFRCFVKLTRSANVYLRVLKKLLARKPDEEGFVVVPLDAEELKVFDKIYAG